MAVRGAWELGGRVVHVVHVHQRPHGWERCMAGRVERHRTHAWTQPSHTVGIVSEGGSEVDVTKNETDDLCFAFSCMHSMRVFFSVTWRHPFIWVTDYRSCQGPTTVAGMVGITTVDNDHNQDIQGV
jgi:hypothetical protein